MKKYVIIYTSLEERGRKKMNRDLMELSQAEFDRLSQMRDTEGRQYSEHILPKPNVLIDTTHVDVDRLNLYPRVYKSDYDKAYEIYNGAIPSDLLL